MWPGFIVVELNGKIPQVFKGDIPLLYESVIGFAFSIPYTSYISDSFVPSS